MPISFMPGGGLQIETSRDIDLRTRVKSVPRRVMSEMQEPAPAWEDKEMTTTSGTEERARLVASPPPSAPTSSRLVYVNLASLALAAALVVLVGYYSFRNGATLFSYHPVAMTLGWVVLMTAAINALRPGDLASAWMPLQLRSTRHWVLQTAAAWVITAGFVIIVTNKFIYNKEHFATVHAIFGLVSVIFAALTISGGVGALYSFKLKRLLPPVYTKLVHGFAGLVTLSLGVVSVVLGLFSHVVSDDGAKWVGAVLAILVGVLTVLRPAVGMYARLKERLGYVH